MQQFPPYFTGYGQQQQQPSQQPQQSQAHLPPQQGQAQLPPQQQQPIQPNIGLANPPFAMYSPMQPLPVAAQGQTQPGYVPAATSPAKRKQVKNACTNCQKACKKCDDARPCPRCIKYGIADTCVNSVRKERKKGVKRGPYKRRVASGESANSSGTSTPNNSHSSTPTASQSTTPNPLHAQAVYGQQPMHFFPPPAAYDPYAYVNNGQMMPQAYMVPAGMPQMYPANPSVLSYQNMIQQQQQQQRLPEFRPQEPTPSVNATDSASATLSEVKQDNEEEHEEEGSKLNLLSRLCSEVLDGNPKQETETSTPQQNTTPPPSRPHSREPSNENNNAAYVNGHFAHLGNTTTHNNVVYGTPGSSPASQLEQQ